MGCCCGTQDGTQERVIQTQIQKAVLEQEQLQSEENQEGEPEVQIEKQEPISKKNKVSEGLIKIENSEGEEQKQEKKQPKKKTIRRDENYMRIMEYKSIKINQYILKPKSDDISNYYELILNITHFDLAFDVYCKGILVTESDQPFNLKPQTYLEASQNSNYDIFFKQDTYFSIDQSINSNRQSFDFLLEVQRTIKRKKEQIGFGTFQAKNQAESSSRNLNSPRRVQKKTKEKFQIEIISEMLEIMHVFDLELCPRFHQLLFFILFQQQMPELKAYFINLSEVYFLFDQKPSIDEFNISKIAIFYEYFDYSLQELQDYLIKEKKQLSHALYLKLFYDLLSVLYNCYQQYMYRCNFTLKSIFYINKSKKFKLQAFARLQTLIRFTKIEDIKNLLMGTNEQKQKFFIKDFEKDLGAVCDIALLFKDANNSISNIKKIRRKKKNSDAHHQKYLLFASELIDGEQTDKLIYEVIRLKCQQISKDNFDYIMEELKTVLLTLEAQFIQETAIRDKKLEQKEEALLQNDSNVGGNPQDLEDGLENDNLFIFSFEIQAPKQTKKIKKQTELDLFNEVKYSSIMYFENFLQNCDNFLKVCTNESHKAYALILLSVGKTINIPSREQRIAEQTAILQEAAKVIGRIQLQLVQDSFNYYCLLSLICKTIDKPIQILNQLRSLIHQQNQIRKKWVRPKLSSLQISTGIIEMRKAIILDLLYIDHFLHKHLYQNATHLVQHIVTQQLKFNLKTYLLYARTLFVSGLLCEKMIQPVSAMLNLEVCRLMYDNYFPIKKLVFIDEETKQQVDIDNQENQKQYKQAFIKFENEASENVNILEFHLGIVYFSLSEKENALKCLRSVREMREKKFDLLSDEVLEVIIQILRIHIEQDENGSAMEICEDYKKKFNQAAKQQVFFKSRQIARLQLIMAAIYECNGMYVSSLKFYQRANKTFSQAKSNSYVRQLHISTKIRKLIEIIKDRGYRSRGLVEPQQFNLENLLGHLSERVKPYFNNQFVRVLENDGIVIYNQKLKRKYIQSNQYLRNLEFQKALRGYLKIHQEFKKSKVDECYGFALEKIGTVYLIQKNMKGSCANLTLAAELHERYLSFPFREIRILTCQMYILVGLAFEQKTKEVQNQISLIDDFIQSINDQLNWQVLSYKLTSNKFAILSNKLGRQSLYQLNDLQDKIVQFNKLKIKIGQNLNNEIALKDISQKYINEKFNQRSSKNLDIQNQRKSCLFGLFNLGNRRQAAKASIVSPIFDHSKLLSPTMKNSEAETKLKPKVQNWINQNSQEKSQKLPTVIIKQQPAQQPIQANTIKSPTSQLQASQQNLKNVKKTIEIPNSDTEYQKNSSKVKSSLPATALVSPALSPISIKSPTQYFSQDKKMNPFEKVKRKK